MLDHSNSQLMERFLETSSSYVSEFLSLLPSKIYGSETFPTKNVSTVFEMHKDDLPEEYAFDMEIQAWHLKWKDDSYAKGINTMPKVLAVTNKTVFPNLFVLFQIGVTHPVTSVVCEQSISTLRFIKNDLRSTMTNNRLNGLALMYVHRNLTKQLDLDEIVDNFAREHPR